jgi:hypothetical protein
LSWRNSGWISDEAFYGQNGQPFYSNDRAATWDYYKLIATISPEDAAKPLEASECPLVKK